MPVIKKPKNMFGLWLSTELDKRGIVYRDFAETMGVKAAYLSMLMRTNEPKQLGLLAEWKERCEQYFAVNG